MVSQEKKVIDYKDPFADLKQWISEIGNRTKEVKDNLDAKAVQVVRNGLIRYSSCLRFECNLFTQENRFNIVANVRNGGAKTYLGCIAFSRKSRTGEDWVRSSDLPDGPLTRETWDEIIKAITHSVFVDVSKECRRMETLDRVVGHAVVGQKVRFNANAFIESPYSPTVETFGTVVGVVHSEMVEVESEEHKGCIFNVPVIMLRPFTQTA